METILKKIDNETSAADKSAIYKEAAAIINSGGLVAFPTETVYGLGGDGMRGESSRKIYAAKGRPSDNPLILHISCEEELQPIAEDISDKAAALMKAFWPGPMTLVFKKKAAVPFETTGGLDSVAVRMPENEVARDFIKACGTPIAAPSANVSGRPSPTNAQRVYEDMSGRIDMIIDGGSVDIGLESTIVDMTGDIPVILRPGKITMEMLQDVVGEVTIDKAILEGASLSEQARPKAPGMKYKHYAPKATMYMVRGNQKAVADYINDKAAELASAGKKVGIIATTESEKSYVAGHIEVIGSRQQDATIARGLFETLRRFDDIGVDVIYTETFEDGAMSGAIMNRLIKAAAHNVIEV